MKIILHHTFRSVKDNLGQLFVIVFTVMVLTALFFATLTLRDVFYNLQLSMATRLPDKAQISVSGDILSEYEIDDALSDIDEIDYVDKYLEMMALFRTVSGDDVDEKVILIEATDLELYATRHADQLTYAEGIDANAVYAYPEVWLSADFAEENGVRVGDTVDLYISLYNSYQKFSVTYLFKSEGVFANTAVNNALTDLTAFGDRGLLTNVYITMKDGADIPATIDLIESRIGSEDVKVKESVDYQHIDSVVSGNQKLITVVMFFVLALVLFILLSSYRVIYQKRTQELSVFRAAGASFGQCILILVFEGLIYGFTGAVLGTVLGRFAMQIAQVEIIPNFTGAIRFYFYHYLLSMLLGVTVSLLCAFFPAFLLVKRSIRASSDKAPLGPIGQKLPLFSALFLLLAVVVMLVIFVPTSVVFVCIALIVLTALIIYFGAPYLVSAVSRLFSVGRGVIKLASSSVRRNRNMTCLAAIVGAVVSFSFVAVSIVSIVIGAIEPYYSHFKCDFVVQSISDMTYTIDAQEEISKTLGVENSILLRYNEYETIADGKEIKYTLYALNNAQDVQNVTSGLTDKELEKFATEDNMIVISYDLSNRFGKNVGDKITLGSEKNKKTYTVVAIDNTITKDDRVCFIVDKSDAAYENASILIVSSKNVSNMDLFKDLSDKLRRYSCHIMYYKDWVQSTNVGISGIELLLRLLQILIGSVAFIGVVNMTVSTLLGRKREYNILFSVGLDAKKYLLLSLTEGIIFALSGGIIGFVFSIVINLLMPELGKLIDRYISASYFPTSIVPVVAVVMLAYVITYVIIAMRIRKNKSIERNIA